MPRVHGSHTTSGSTAQYSDVLAGTSQQRAPAGPSSSSPPVHTLYGTHAHAGSASQPSAHTVQQPSKSVDSVSHGTHTPQPEWQDVQARLLRRAQRSSTPVEGNSNMQTSLITKHEEKSRYTNETPPAGGHVAELTPAPRAKPKVFYIGNVQPHCSATSIAKWCSDHGVDIVQCVVYASAYFRTAYARVTVEADDEEKVANKAFWPDMLSHTIRPWRFKSDSFGTSTNDVATASE